jgi:N-acetyl sugar amidotransferase
MTGVISCKKCVLTSEDYPKIRLDHNGVCDICITYENQRAKFILKDEVGSAKLANAISEIRKSGRDNKYDCIIGVSGGVDSSFLVCRSMEWGLRPLLFHVDSGWNTETAVKNIEKILKFSGYNYDCLVLDWPQIRELEKAFIRANVLDIDLPFDNAYIAALYRKASELNIKFILTGHNYTTEGYLPPNFTHNKLDSINIRAINRKFGNASLKGFPLISPVQEWYYRKIKRIRIISPLDWMDYNKSEAKEFLKEKTAWLDHGGKHCENIYTRFYQRYILPRKFGVDKRKSHFQSLICSGEMTRHAALEFLNTHDYYRSKEMESFDKAYFLSKMQMKEEEFNEYIRQPAVSHLRFCSHLHFYRALTPLRIPLRFIKRIFA